MASPTTYRFTVKDYHRMAEFKILGPKDRVELLDGVVFDMTRFNGAGDSVTPLAFPDIVLDVAVILG